MDILIIMITYKYVNIEYIHVFVYILYCKYSYISTSSNVQIYIPVSLMFRGTGTFILTIAATTKRHDIIIPPLSLSFPTLLLFFWKRQENEGRFSLSDSMKEVEEGTASSST